MFSNFLRRGRSRPSKATQPAIEPMETRTVPSSLGHPLSLPPLSALISDAQAGQGRPVNLSDFFPPPPKSVLKPGLTADQLMAQWQANLNRLEQRIAIDILRVSSVFTGLGAVGNARFWYALTNFERATNAYSIAKGINGFKGIVNDPFATKTYSDKINAIMSAHPYFFAAHPNVTAILNYLIPANSNPPPALDGDEPYPGGPDSDGDTD